MGERKDGNGLCDGNAERGRSIDGSSGKRGGVRRTDRSESDVAG